LKIEDLWYRSRSAGACAACRFVFYIAIDHLTLIVFKQLTPTFFFINARIPLVCKETEIFFALFAQNKIDNCLIFSK